MTECGDDRILTQPALFVVDRTPRLKRSLLDDPITLACGRLLVLSGLFHLTALVITGATWEGSVSLRKPGLFGISGGLTLFSLIWVTSRLIPHKYDQTVGRITAVSMVGEVGLITLQFWRGVPSHFNTNSWFDRSVEHAMLGLIVIVVAHCLWISGRMRSLQNSTPAESTAIRGGMACLLISCAIGFVISVIGHANQSLGQPAELWGTAGALKYPHGACLHAIQTLAILAWITDRFDPRSARQTVRFVLISHLLFLAHAVWQVGQGHSRMDVDLIGGLLLWAAVAFVTFPIGFAISRYLTVPAT